MKKILLLVLILLTINTNVYAEEDLSQASWWIYDHTNFQDNAIISDSEHKYIEYHKEIYPNNYVIDRHMNITNNGKTIDFKGYGTTGYMDFVYYPSNNNNTKAFSLNINKTEETYALWHTFDGLIIFFNTNITGNYVDNTQRLNTHAVFFGENGTYLLELRDINIKEFTQGGLEQTIGQQKNAFILGNERKNPFGAGTFKIIGKFYTIIQSSFNKIKLVVSKNSVKLYAHSSNEYYTEELADWNLMEWTTGNSSTAKEVNLSSISSGYGFGLGIQYSGHSCPLRTNFIVTDLSLPVKLDLENPIIETETPPIESEPDPEIIQNCSDAEYREKYPELCKNVVCEGFEDTELGVFLQDIFTYMQIGVVVLLILTGSIDFVKAMSSKDSQQMKKFQNDFIKRLIIGAVIFFVPALVNFLFPLLGIGGSCGIK